MTPGPETLLALEHLRRTAVAAAELCDTVILGRPVDARRALRDLPARVRVLIFRANRALTALESEGTP